MKIETTKENKIDPSLRSEVDSLLLECFSEQPDFEKYLSMLPDPTWRLCCKDEILDVVAHLAVHEREVGTSSGDMTIGLISNVAVAPSARRQGLARDLLSEAHTIMRASEIPFSILFADIPEIYHSSGYSLMDNPIRFWDNYIEEPAWRTLVYRGSMICQLGDQELPSGVIDLRGPTV